VSKIWQVRKQVAHSDDIPYPKDGSEVQKVDSRKMVEGGTIRPDKSASQRKFKGYREDLGMNEIK